MRTAALAPLLLAALAAILPAGAPAIALEEAAVRTVTGSLVHRERIALPAGAVVLLEVRGADGDVVAKARFPLKGRQAPVPFAVEVPAAARGAVLRAAIRADGAIRFLSGGVPVPDDEDPAPIGEIVLARHVPMGFSSTLACGETRVRVGFAGRNAVLEVAGERVVLEPVPVDEGRLFRARRDPGTLYRHSGPGKVSIAVGGRDLGACTLLGHDPG